MKKLIVAAVLLMTVICMGCNKKDLDIFKPQTPETTGHDFALTMESVPFIIAKYTPLALHLRIVPSGQQPATQYKISYVQFLGSGMLEDESGVFLGQNIEYDLNDRTFILKYTSFTDTEHFFEITVKDNFGNIKKQKVKFMPENEVAMGK
ncbi:TraQ conjugal transfer family protein [Flavobacterium sp. UBA4197]|uniref:TraQ conjugal transfer family protein n=1 Tax=Flavobacterium sp. UBA4197 TaxID=1946546 RepID=UPI00257F0DFE|nr:TraQ conjugal transfer family protein [Flavobacterium sp. UBA4197]